MTAKEAYQIVKKAFPKNPCLDCWDYGKFYGFSVAPEGYDIDHDLGFGGGITTVIKETGERGTFNPVIDGFDLLRNAVEVPKDQYMR